MTDIDIERLTEYARTYTLPNAHPPGEDFASPSCGWCAVLALIERLENAEAQRDRLLDDIAYGSVHLGPWLSPALDDSNACGEFKTIISEWMRRNQRALTENKPMNNRDGGPAYPGDCEDFGMTMRKYYKAVALIGLMSDSKTRESLLLSANKHGRSFAQECALQCGDMANSMLAEDEAHEREAGNE